MDKQLTELEFLRWLYNDVVAEGGGSVSKELWHRIQYLETKQEVCEWNYDFGYYESACGLSWQLSNDDGLKANEVFYCQKCGRKIELKKVNK